MGDLEYVNVPVCKERMKGLENRIDKVEAVVDEIRNLTLSVERLAITVENLVKRDEVNESRIKALEEKDGEMWRSIVRYAITAVASFVIGYVMKNVGF